MDKSPSTSHRTAVFRKNEVFRQFFAFCTPSPLLVPEGGINMSPFDQPRTVSTSKSSGGGGRRKQSRDNMPTFTAPKNLACIQNYSSLHTNIQVDIHGSHQDMHSHPNIYVNLLRIYIHEDTHADKPLHKHTHTHASASLQSSVRTVVGLHVSMTHFH